MENEEPSLYRYLNAKKRDNARTVRQIQDADGNMQTAPLKVLQIFTDHFHRKYYAIPVANTSIQEMIKAIPTTIPPEAHPTMDAPISIDEIKHAIRRGKPHKAAGSDGIGHDFYAKTWDMSKDDRLQVLNAMYIDGQITATHKRGLLVCIPKTNHPTRVDQYRPLTLLNVDFTLLTRILAARIRPSLKSILHPEQHCGVGDATVYDELETIRDAIASAENSRQPLRLISLDFKDAFDNISHTYLFSLLHAYGFSTHLQTCIRDIYTGATSHVKVNGHISRPIPIRSSVRQGCPLSLALFALCLDPLLHSIAQTLPGYRIGRLKTSIAVLAYADDVTVFLTSPADVMELRNTLEAYTTATGARINVNKSKAMAVSSWDTTINVLDIPYVEEMKILGIRFSAPINQAAKAKWDVVTRRIRSLTLDAYYRDLRLAWRITYIHCYVLASAWYTAQIFPVHYTHIRQINSILAWYLWRGEIFRVPLSTLHRDKRYGGWGLVDFAAKSRTLFLCRLLPHTTIGGPITSDWLKSWKLHKPALNPPHITGVPATLEYLRILALDAAYVPPPEPPESRKAYRCWVYKVMHILLSTTTAAPTMRIEIKWPSANWCVV
jgi:hypothetical protein